jgi:hypothetical protein
MVVGYPAEGESGAVDIYQRVSGNWQFHQRIVKSPNLDDDFDPPHFGDAVKFGDNYLAVSMPEADGGIISPIGVEGHFYDSGIVVIFSLNSVGQWEEEARLTNIHRGASPSISSRYGSNLEWYGDHLIVGAEAEDTDGIANNAGVVRIYSKIDGIWERSGVLYDEILGKDTYHLGVRLKVVGDTLVLADKGFQDPAKIWAVNIPSWIQNPDAPTLNQVVFPEGWQVPSFSIAGDENSFVILGSSSSTFEDQIYFVRLRYPLFRVMEIDGTWSINETHLFYQEISFFDYEDGRLFLSTTDSPSYVKDEDGDLVVNSTRNAFIEVVEFTSTGKDTIKRITSSIPSDPAHSHFSFWGFGRIKVIGNEIYTSIGAIIKGDGFLEILDAYDSGLSIYNFQE